MQLAASPLSSTNAWYEAVESIMDNGDLVNPRTKQTMELLCNRVTVDMNRPVLLCPARKIGYKFMAAEAAWILSGDNRVETIMPFAKHIASFSDDGIQYFGAYGPQIRDQMHHINRTLRRDPASRQAVLSIWRPSPPDTKDVPCTVAIQFLIRKSVLHLFVTMRSSDVWLGLPYDVFSFSMLGHYVRTMLKDKVKVSMGSLTVVAGSQHLYLENFEEARAIMKSASRSSIDDILAMTFDKPSHLVEWLWARAHAGDLVHKLGSCNDNSQNIKITVGNTGGCSFPASGAASRGASGPRSLFSGDGLPGLEPGDVQSS